MIIPTEPIGSTLRTTALIHASKDGRGTKAAWDPLDEDAIRDTIVEASGSHVITKGALNRVLEAAEFILISQLGTTVDCGFSPFCDDVSMDRTTAFAKIRARVQGTALDAAALGVG